MFLAVPTSVYASLTYTNLGNDVYAFRQSQLTKVTLAGNDLNFTELENDGLLSNLITSLNRCGKYVYATTYSGLFYRDITGFDKPKK